MKLTVLNSNSRGNCYILHNADEALILECGVKISEVKKALNFNIAKTVGCIVTHEHGDHFKFAADFLNAGIQVYASPGTIGQFKSKKCHIRPVEIYPKIQRKLGGFSIIPFDVVHDAVQPLGFQIDHPETGRMIFVTDTYYIPYTFAGLDQILIECNYASDILEDNHQKGRIVQKVKNRVLKSHMSLSTCLAALQANDLTRVRNIVLLHLSDKNSNENQFLQEVKEATGKRVFIAKKGLEVELNKNLF